MNSVIDNLTSRPRFFTGQLIDYRDFNQLAARPDEVLSAILRHLYPGGGIMGDFPSSNVGFAVQLRENNLAEISPGTAILPNGQILVLKEAKLVDLTPYLGNHQAKTVVVSARNVLRGDQHYTDPDDNTVTGFKSESFAAEIFMSDTSSADQAVELLRVILPTQANKLRLMTNLEQWRTDAELASLMMEAPGTGVIDLRYRKVVTPTLANPWGVEKMLLLRKAMKAIRSAIEKLARTYFVPDQFKTENYLSLLHAELLSQPFQPRKLSFLVSELAEKICFYVENLMNKTEATRSDFNRGLALEVIEMLQPARSLAFQPDARDVLNCFETLLLTEAKLREMVNFSEAHYSLSGTIREALIELQNRQFNFLDKISIAGRVFEKVDEVQIANDKRWSSQPGESHRRKISAEFKDGQELALNGAFVRNGRFFCTFDVKHSNRPLLLLLNQYIRRAGSKIHYELNGKTLETQVIEDPGLENSWINKGLVVAPELLVAGENQFSIAVEKTDLDFGFFGAHVYQPVVAEAQL